MTRSAPQKEMVQDFADFGPVVTQLLRLTKPNLDIVFESRGSSEQSAAECYRILQRVVYDLGDHAVPTFYKDRICIVGDAAHATSPDHGAGAGLCIEDSAALAELLADDGVKAVRDLEAVFAIFNAQRRERGQWLVNSSRRVGDCYEWRAQRIGRDFGKIEAEINERNGVIANVDLRQMCKVARQQLVVQVS
ncbi:hypothetical protein B0A48_18794 [Cryoendolithus antarcticus]|uniref:FAD-binding domain-containing protein n=1 Tax=Cryoendolithus antarcticus TaxID=1507870 RepID=A0A1V8S880_9PEZI|nr:hypothetical protein B0A48_18794 [Cryoendolithus antarcticus]